MPKKGDAASSGGGKGTTGRGRARDGSRRRVNGSRAGPRTVPRGSFPLPQGKVLDANAFAARVLGACDGINFRSGRLSFSDPALDKRMVQAIEKDRAGNGYGHPVIAARVRTTRTEPYRMLVVAVRPDGDPGGVGFIALVFAPNGQHEISPEVLRQVYGLTRAQSAVARSLFAGRSVEDTALALNLSLNTIRTHVKHIFTKCEVGSQGELLHMLALGPHAL